MQGVVLPLLLVLGQSVSASANVWTGCVATQGP